MSSRLSATVAFAALTLSTLTALHLISKMTPRPPPAPSSSSSSSSPSVRFVIISDTHRVYTGEIPPGDVLIHAGDSELSAPEMERWARAQPHAHKIAVCGNMDRALSCGQGKLHDVTYLQDSAVDVGGIKVYGSPWTPRFVGVFQLEGESEAREVWGRVPRDVDVLVSHGPPRGVLDQTSRGMRVGDAALLERVRKVRPRVHCFGHVHESYGTERRGETVFCNAAVFNGHPPLVVDVPLDKRLPATVVSGGQ